MADSSISIASEIVNSNNGLLDDGNSIASQILAEQKRRAAIEGKLAEDQNQRIPADLQAKALPIAKENGIPVDTARRNLGVLEKEKLAKDIDAVKTEAPSYAKLIVDGDHGPIAKEAVSELPYFERVLRSYRQAFAGGMEDLEISDIGFKMRENAASEADIARLKELKEARKKRADYQIGAVGEFFQYPVQSAPATAATFARTWDEILLGAGTGAATAFVAGQLGPQVALPEELVTVPAGAIAGARIGARVGLVKESYQQLAGDAYVEALDVLDENGNPLDSDTAYAVSTFAGGVGAVAELLPFEKALDTMPFLKGAVGREGARRLASYAANNPAVRASLSRIGRVLKVGGAEAFTEVLQEATVLEGLIAAGGVFDSDGNVLADQRGERYSGAAVGGFAGGSTLGAAGEILTAGVQTVSSYSQKRAELKRQSLVDLGDRIRKSRVNGISPETIVAHAKQIDADEAGPQMSAPVGAIVSLFQSEGLTPEQVQTEFPDIARGINEAAESDAEVPLNAEAVVKLARLNGFANITGDIRMAPEELTANEEKEQSAELNNLIANVSAEDEKVAVRASIENEVTKQLVAAGTDPRAAATMAKVHASTITNLAERSGMDADTLLKRFPLKITGDQQTDMTAVDPNATMLQRAKDAAYGEPALRINGRVFKPSDLYPNWPKGNRPEAGKGAMSAADEQAMGDVDLGPGMPEDPYYGHVDILQEARKVLGADVVNKAVDDGDGNHFGFVNANGEFKSVLDLNRSGQPINAPDTEALIPRQIDTPEFRNWFDESKVVGEVGAPLVVYHGTDQSFDTFGRTEDIGYHFGAESAAKARVGGLPNARIMPVYLNIRNPLRVKDHTDWDIGNVLQEFVSQGLIDQGAAEKLVDSDFVMTREWVRDTLASNGYDGMVYRNDVEGGGDSYIVFEPTQIKSATGNRGTFDPNDPNILYQGAPTSPEEQAAIDTASLDSSNTLSKSQAWQKGRDLKIAMQDRVLAALRKLGVDPSVRSPEAIQYLVKVGVKDALAALTQNPNAIGWYDVKTRQALAVMSLVHPEIMTEPNARFAFTWALAVTSNGIKVGKNFELADAVYRRYKSDGRMPTDITAGQAQKAINNALELFNDLSNDWGIDNLRQFMLTDFTVSEITGINKELSPSGEFAETRVRGAAILGPKIGNGFFSNLYGVFDALTMDRWLVRTWGRWTGTLIKIDLEQVSGARGVLRDMAGKVDIPALAAGLRSVKKTTKTKGETEVKPADRERLIAALEAGWDTDEKVDALATAVQKASQDPQFRTVMNDTAGGRDLRTKGNNLAKYIDGQKEQPAGPAERNYIREVFQAILDELKAGNDAYAGLTMADLQAVLWYAEKRLYETAKEDTVVTDDVADDGVSGYEDEEAPDYANAAAAQARADGVLEDKIKATLQQEANRGSATRTGTAGQSGTGSAQGDVAGGQGSGAQAARGFTRGEKRSLIQRSAIHRIRSNRNGDEAASWSYARSGREDGGRPRVLKKLGVRHVGEWKAGQKLRMVFKANGISTPTIYELQTGSAENAARFVSAIEEARTSLGPIGEAVKVYRAEEYAAMRMFLSEDGKAGFALKPDGDIISVFSFKGTGAGRAIMETAIAAGGRKLDCFDTILPDFYAVHGFRGTSRLPWNDEIAMADMPNWDKAAFAEFNNGEPDVVFMAYDPSHMGGYDQEATPVFEGDNAYDEAVQAQSSAVPNANSTTLFQRAKTTQPVARGSIEIAPMRASFKITLTGKADLSTFMHEAGHYYLEVIQELVESGAAAPQLVSDLAKTRKWIGLKENEKIDRRHHEQWARGFEAYLMEGRAPSTDLQGVFNRFRAWLVFIYKKLTALDVELTDEVRGVMDRLVASDREISEARTNIGWAKPLPKEALFLSDDEYDRYVEAWNKASQAQQREVDAKLMLEAARETQAAWKQERQQIMDEEKAKLAQTRGHRAWKLLTTGEGLEAAASGRTSLKINPATVPSEWSRDAAGMTDETGLPLDAVAEILGFNSGEQMIQLIAGAKFADRDLPSRVRKIMSERHGDMDMAALADAANEAVHSDDTQEVLLTEFRAMAAKAGIQNVPPGLTKWMAAKAQQRVLGLTRRQLDPMRWRRAEISSAQKSASAKDPSQAAIHKRQQMMASAMYKATTDAQKRVEVIGKKLMPFTKNDRRAKLGKAGEIYLDGIDHILEDIQLKPMSAASIQKLDRLQKLVEEADRNGEPLVLPDKLRAMLGKKNFADMTLEELEGVHDSVMNIWHLAKTKNELKARKEKRDLEQALTEMEANAQAALGDRDVTVKFTEGWKDRAAARMRSFRAGLVKMEFLFGWLDGKPDGGLMHRLIYQPIADANKAKFDILQRFHKTIIERMRSMPAEQKARWESKRTFMGNPTANGATIISAALNLGNAGNRTKLLEGYGWNEQQLMAEINAFMTKADWDFVQHVWDEIDTLWPKIEATTKAATGLAPEKVVPTPIITPHGTYAGGYYPVVYDPNQTEQQFKNQQESAGLFTNNYARPTLGDGFTKARVDYAAPIKLELSVISQHLAEVVHYVTHYEAVTQADKITRHPRFQALVKGHMGNEFYRTIRPWLQDVARDQDTPAITNQEPFAKAMRHLRGGVSIAAMGYNIFTGVKQLIGVVQSLDAVGPKYWLSGLVKAWASPKAIANWKFAFENSQELKPLVTQLDRDIKMVNDAYARQTAMNMPANVFSWAFKHIGWLQAAVNVATWHGAYEQEIAVSGEHERAVMHADSVVRKTQSAGAVKDLSPIQRGTEINRAISMFYSWFNVLYNRLEDINRETKSIRDVPKAAARVAILVMMSSMIEEAGRRAWEGIVDNYDDDEEEPGYILSVLLKSADTLIGALPLARVFLSPQAATGGLTPDLIPVAGVVDNYWRTLSAARDLVMEGETPSRSEVKAAVRTVSIIGGVPLSGPYNFLDEMFGEAVFNERKKK